MWSASPSTWFEYRSRSAAGPSRSRAFACRERPPTGSPGLTEPRQSAPSEPTLLLRRNQWFAASRRSPPETVLAGGVGARRVVLQRLRGLQEDFRRGRAVLAKQPALVGDVPHARCARRQSFELDVNGAPRGTG